MDGERKLLLPEGGKKSLILPTTGRSNGKVTLAVFFFLMTAADILSVLLKDLGGAKLTPELKSVSLLREYAANSQATTLVCISKKKPPLSGRGIRTQYAVVPVLDDELIVIVLVLLSGMKQCER